MKNNYILPSGVYTTEICELSLWKDKETGGLEILFDTYLGSIRADEQQKQIDKLRSIVEDLERQK